MPCRENEYEPVPDVSPGLSMVWVKVNVRFVAPLGTVTGIVEDTREDPDSTVRVNVYTTMPSTSTCPVDAPIDGPQLIKPVSYTHLRAHETVLDLVCRLLLEKKK